VGGVALVGCVPVDCASVEDGETTADEGAAGDEGVTAGWAG
jgi:hypothetical protein